MERKQKKISPSEKIAREVKRKLREGRGKGEGRGYKPWIMITETSSHGVSHEIEGWKTGRTHHFLSDLERNVFYVLQWIRNIRDIREQFPLLPLSETIAIAKQLGVRHPGELSIGVPTVMTTDFVVTEATADGRQKLGAIDCKYEIDLANERALEKLDIARCWWQRRNIDWRLVTEREILADLVSNLQFIDGAYHYDDELREAYRESTPHAPPNDVKQLIADLAEQIKAAPKVSLSFTCRKADDRFGFAGSEFFGAGTCLKLVRFALLRRIWRIPMGQRIDPMKPAPNLCFGDEH